MKIKSSLALLFVSWSHQSCTPKVLNQSQGTHLGQLLDKQRTVMVHCGQFMNEERFTHVSV